ncbi:HNH endonuclease [Stenotrophomonas maltophilia]|nr:HNH endonuclease [Stenotrophomonas maltophilia]MCU1213022.1 HNH endonuclease [Stenotrophomonas maltophilia]
MGVFQYPKGLHRRRLQPFPYKKYKSFKRVLQHEFVRVCVYCRTPDSVSPGEYYSFAVDHYRPKVVPRFKHLETSYGNLYYCCGPCNSRKNDYWPADERLGPFVVNPCEHDMAAHLRLNASTFEYESRTPDGAHMIRLLQLNEPDIVGYRRRIVETIEMANLRRIELGKKLAEAKKKFGKGLLSAAELAKVEEIVARSMITVLDIIESNDGTKAPRPLPRTVK